MTHIAQKTIVRSVATLSLLLPFTSFAGVTAVKLGKYSVANESIVGQMEIKDVTDQGFRFEIAVAQVDGAHHTADASGRATFIGGADAAIFAQKGCTIVFLTSASHDVKVMGSDSCEVGFSFGAGVNVDGRYTYQPPSKAKLPADAAKFVDTVQACIYFSGEISGDNPERDEELNRKMIQLGCDKPKALLASGEALSRKYAKDSDVVAAIRNVIQEGTDSGLFY